MEYMFADISMAVCRKHPFPPPPLAMPCPVATVLRAGATHIKLRREPAELSDYVGEVACGQQVAPRVCGCVCVTHDPRCLFDLTMYY